VATHEEPLPTTNESPRKPNRRRRALIGGGFALFVIVLLVLPVFSTLQPGYYGRYPDLRVRIDHWRSSTHARISCIECHVEPGVRGFAEFAIESIPTFYSQMLEGSNQNNMLEAPGILACQKCHTNFRQVSPDGDLLIPHRAHVEVLKVECVVCHKSLVHSENTQGFNRPEMSMCFDTCHDGVQATDECVKCHTRKATPKSHTAANWLEVHSRKVESTDCGSCHSWTPDYCDECHQKRPKSHAGNWKTDHQIRAKKSSTGCLVCHGGEKFCKTCH
jgi:hypothetical protein